MGFMCCWPGSLKAKADQGVSLQQSGRNLSCIFAMLATAPQCHILFGFGS